MKISPAAKFWIGVGAYVFAADAVLWRQQQNTMSIQFGSWLKTPHGRKLAVAGWSLLTAHLFYSIPLPGQTTLKKVVMYNGRNGTSPHYALIEVPIEKGI